MHHNQLKRFYEVPKSRQETKALKRNVDEPQTQDTDSSEDSDEIPQRQDGNLEEQNAHLEIHRRPQRLRRPPDWIVEYKMNL